MADRARLLPVAIMAHNEEKVIAAAVRGVLKQTLPPGCSLRLIVVANACRDNTEGVVRDLQRETPGTIVLLSVADKGKTRAINRTIEYLSDLSARYEIHHVVFVDADTEFVGNEALLRFQRLFAEEPGLAAVGGTPVPDVVFDSRTSAVARLYRAMHAFRSGFRSNVISGMCYAITLEALRRLNLPELQLAEDLYICKRLSGRFLQDDGVRVVYRTPPSIRADLERRTRQAVNTQRYAECLDRLRAGGEKVKLFEASLGPAYEFVGVGFSRKGKLGHWLSLRGIEAKVFVMLYAMLLAVAKLRAGILLRMQGPGGESDIWTITR